MIDNIKDFFHCFALGCKQLGFVALALAFIVFGLFLPVISLFSLVLDMGCQASNLPDCDVFSPWSWRWLLRLVGLCIAGFWAVYFIYAAGRRERGY